jgi:hypothetical protein
MPDVHTMTDAAAEFKIAIVLASDQASGVAANIAACIAAGLAAASPHWAGQPLTDAAGLKTVASSHEPIAILAAEPARMSELMKRLAQETHANDGFVSLFPAYAQAIHTGGVYWHRHGLTVHAQESVRGIGFCGHRRWVNRFTGSLPLWR